MIVIYENNSSVCAEFGKYIVLKKHFYLPDEDKYCPKLILYDINSNNAIPSFLDDLCNDCRIYFLINDKGTLSCLAHNKYTGNINIIKIGQNKNVIEIIGNYFICNCKDDFSNECFDLIPDDNGNYFINIATMYFFYELKTNCSFRIEDEFIIQNGINVIGYKKKYIFLIGAKETWYDKFCGLLVNNDFYYYAEYLAIGCPFKDCYTIIANCNGNQSIIVEEINNSYIIYSVYCFDRDNPNLIGEISTFRFSFLDMTNENITVDRCTILPKEEKANSLYSKFEYEPQISGDYIFSLNKAFYVPNNKWYETDRGCFQCCNNHLYLLLNYYK